MSDKIGKLVKDCRLAAKCLRDAGEFETGQSILEECADVLADLIPRSEAEAMVAATCQQHRRFVDNFLMTKTSVPVESVVAVCEALDADPDARAAFDKMRAEARRGAIKEAALKCADAFAEHMTASICGLPDNSPRREAAANMAERLLHEIRALVPLLGEGEE